MTSLLNWVRESLCSAKRGFLLSDALIALAVICMMALMAHSALSMHASAVQTADEALMRIEEEALWHLKDCQSCVPEAEQDSSSETP
jgi:hypothetical protein